MKDIILTECRKDISRFSNMTDIEIYNWMCDTFACKDYEMIRECSFIIFNESRISRYRK